MAVSCASMHRSSTPRARNLHALARTVAGSTVAENGVAKLPEDPQALIKLPGIGPYTAGAVASFAYEKAVPAVDTDAARVFRRVFFGDSGSRERGAGPDGASRA